MGSLRIMLYSMHILLLDRSLRLLDFRRSWQGNQFIVQEGAHHQSLSWSYRRFRFFVFFSFSYRYAMLILRPCTSQVPNYVLLYSGDETGGGALYALPPHLPRVWRTHPAALFTRFLSTILLFLFPGKTLAIHFGRFPLSHTISAEPARIRPNQKICITYKYIAGRRLHTVPVGCLLSTFVALLPQTYTHTHTLVIHIRYLYASEMHTSKNTKRPPAKGLSLSLYTKPAFVSTLESRSSTLQPAEYV